MFKKVLRYGLAVAGAAVGVYGATRFLLKNPDTGAGYIEIKPGVGWDDAAQGAGALIGGYAGFKLGGMFLGGAK